MKQLRSARDYGVEEDPGSRKSCANERRDDIATNTNKMQQGAQNPASRECEIASTSETLQSATQTTRKRHTDSGTWWPVRENQEGETGQVRDQSKEEKRLLG